jgi:predicted Zn-dependent protease
MIQAVEQQLGDLIDLLPLSIDISIGQDAAPSVEEELGPVLMNPALTQYVEKVGNRLIPFTKTNLPYRFQILDNDQINAFALPGGNVYVTTGLLRSLSSEAQLAAILGHEISHAADRHGIKQLGVGAGATILTQIALGSSMTSAMRKQLTSFLMGLLSSGYSRHHEEKADALGLEMAARSGYNPWGAVEVMRLFDRLDGEDPGLIEALFQTHPVSGERADELERRVRSRFTNKGYVGQEEYQQAVYGRLPAPRFDVRNIGWVVVLGIGFAGLWWLYDTLSD